MVRTKFKLVGVEAGSIGVKAQDGSGWESKPSRTFKFLAVTAADGGEENRLFGDATPSGEIRMTVVAERAQELLTAQLGQEVYVTFEPTVVLEPRIGA